MRKAMYAGTFDPFTNGHDDILRRSLELFDEVTILIAVSPTKKPLFTPDERVEMLEETFADDSRVKVDCWSGLLVDYAREKGIGTIIRGLRPTGDFEVEFQMASMNKRLFSQIETVFLVTEGENYYVSSSLVKEIHRHKRDVKEFLPDNIYNWLQRKEKKKGIK